jgi:hypothetical protein
MGDHLADGELAEPLTMHQEHGPLPQRAATGDHLADGALVVRQMMPLERNLPQERASPLVAAPSLDGQSVYEYEELYADALSLQRSLYEDELSKCALEYAGERSGLVYEYEELYAGLE